MVGKQICIFYQHYNNVILQLQYLICECKKRLIIFLYLLLTFCELIDSQNTLPLDFLNLHVMNTKITKIKKIAKDITNHDKSKPSFTSMKHENQI
jgi:hypothetical protein